MKRSHVLFLLALVVMAGLYIYDRDNSTQTQLTAKVHSIEETLNGQRSSHIVTVEIDGALHPITALEERPVFRVGDTICVTRVSRQGVADNHHLSATSDC